MSIIVCSLSRVPEIIIARKPSRVVSLLDPETVFPDAARHGVARHLKLKVHDIIDPFPGDVPPAAEHVKELLEFVSDWDRSDCVLVHCYAGISRSTASAYTIACALNPQADEGAIARSLRQASPTAWPNKRIISLADAELGREGRMTRAIAAIGHGLLGDDIDIAAPFEIPSRYDAR
ncbi:MAG: protein tyrosine phosphatase [Hyphomonadaceae bacterium]|nr:protein tyrosine phosphatase [Hyphomonadaceae bacterium]